MARTVRAKYSNGVIRPLDPVEVAEGADLVVEIRSPEEVREARERAYRFMKDTASAATASGVSAEERERIAVDESAAVRKVRATRSFGK